MPRFLTKVLTLALPLALTACLAGPDRSPQDASSADTLPPPALASGPSGQRIAGDPGGEAGGILLISDQLGRWCTCADSHVPRQRMGVGIKFRWQVADPVAVDRFATFRFLVNGTPVTAWGNQREWPVDDDDPLFWFPSAGMQTVTVEKMLSGEMTELVATFEIVAP